jgi:alpha-L-rhamnosidase
MFQLAELIVEYQTKPKGIVCKHPRFSWKYKAEKNIIQKSYRILVASKAELLEVGKADLWDSNIVTSNKMHGTKYQGKELKSLQICYVKLIVVSDSQTVSTMETTFEMGLINDSDWKGKWVSIPTNFQGGTLYFRKKLEKSMKNVVRARAYVCGLGYHELYINGKKVSDSVLNPGVTEYSKTILYDIYDITDYLNDEDNVVGVEVGYGWLGQRKMLAQFYFEFADGSIYEDHSDCNHGWWVSGSPVIDNSIYGGEVYDATLEERYPGGWSTSDFEPTWGNGWMYTILTQAPQGKLTPQLIEPIRVIRDYPEVSRKQISEKSIVFDIGQNIAGWAKISVKGTRGNKVTLIYGEGLCEDGSVNQLNLRSARCSDTYILKGEGTEEYAPRFTYHGFQYVQVEIEGNVEIISLKGQLVRTDVEIVGHFECSDSVLNQLHKNAVITEENNIHSILTDCPQRDERFGWLNDLTSRVYQTINNFRLDRLLPKIIQDISETQTSEGTIADTAPYYTGGRPADVTSVSYLLLAYKTYKYYGDIEVLQKGYDGFKGWVEYLLTRHQDYIMDYYYYADWVAPECFKDSVTDNIYVSTVFLNWHLKLMAKIAQIVDNTKDFEKYSQMAKASKEAINRKYYNKETKNYSNGTQAENSLALNLNIAPVEDRDEIAKNIADDIIKHNYHSTCGNQGYRHLFYTLTEAGYIDLLIKMIKNPEYPGWGYMLECGATTVWERWESTMANIMHSYNHPMFGSYDAWFYRYFAGICIEDGENAENIVIKPVIPKY